MSLRHVLFPVDFSEKSRAIAPAVEAVVRHDGARLTLLHALDMPYGELGAAPIGDEVETARLHQRLRLQEFEAARWEGIEVTRVETAGKPAATIAAHAAANPVDLIMMPTTGFTRFRPLLLGSVTAAVLHDSQCPVWTSAHAEDAPPALACRKMVCAIDAGPHTQSVLTAAGVWARNWGAELRVVHSVTAIDERFYSAAAERAHGHLIELARREYPELAHAARVDAPLEVLEGASLIAPIVEAARGADLLVIGRGAIQGVLGRLRNHAHELIRTAPCPVLSV